MLLSYSLSRGCPVTTSCMYVFLRLFLRIPQVEMVLSFHLYYLGWGTCRGIIVIFHRNEYCFRVRNLSRSHERITQVIVCSMEAYIPHSVSQPKCSKPRFNTAYLCDIHDREDVHKSCVTLFSPEFYSLYIFVRNLVKSVL